MEIKWFFVVLGVILVSMMLIGIYFIAANISTQSYKQYEDAQIRADERYANSTIVHNKQTDNITSEILYLGDRLYPILDQIPNATQSKIDQDKHYNQTAQDFERIAQVLELKLIDHNTLEKILEIKLEDHETLSILNQSVNSILKVLNNTKEMNGTIIEVPIPIVINNGSAVAIKNITTN